MAAWRYDTFHLVLKDISLIFFFAHLWNIFQHLKLPCNILSLLKKKPMKYQVILCLKHDIFIHEDNMLSSHVLWYFQTWKEKFRVSVPSCNLYPYRCYYLKFTKSKNESIGYWKKMQLPMRIPMTSTLGLNRQPIWHVVSK